MQRGIRQQGQYAKRLRIIAESAPLGQNRVKVSENLDATAVALVAPVVTSLYCNQNLQIRDHSYNTYISTFLGFLDPLLPYVSMFLFSTENIKNSHFLTPPLCTSCLEVLNSKQAINQSAPKEAKNYYKQDYKYEIIVFFLKLGQFEFLEARNLTIVLGLYQSPRLYHK